MEKNINTRLYTYGIFVFVFMMLAGFQVQAREHVREIQKPAYPHSLRSQLTEQLVPFRPYVKSYVYNTFDGLNISLAESYLEHQKMKGDTSTFFNTLKSHWRHLFREVVKSEFRDFFTATLLGVSTRQSSSSGALRSKSDNSLLGQPFLFQLKPKLKVDINSGNFEVGFEKKLKHGFVGEASFDTEHSLLEGSLKKQISDDFYFHMKTSSEFSDNKNKDFEIGFNFNF